MAINRIYICVSILCLLSRCAEKKDSKRDANFSVAIIHVDSVDQSRIMNKTNISDEESIKTEYTFKLLSNKNLTDSLIFKVNDSIVFKGLPTVGSFKSVAISMGECCYIKAQLGEKKMYFDIPKGYKFINLKIRNSDSMEVLYCQSDCQ